MTLRGRSLLHTGEWSRKDLESLLDLALRFKGARRPSAVLRGKRCAFIFFNSSLRTRCSMEVAVQRLGGESTTLDVGAGVWNLEHRDGVVMDADRPEHVKDACSVISRWFDLIGVRCFPKLQDLREDLSDPVLESFRRHSKVPLVNLESSLWHPCQALADILTIRETFGKTDGLPVALLWVPHVKPLPLAVPNSFAVIAAQFGCDLRVIHPPEFPLPDPVISALGKVRIANSLEDLCGVRVLYAKSWTSLPHYGDAAMAQELRRKYESWMVSRKLLATAGNPKVMHCMPFRRNVEIADDVADSDASLLYSEAENRLWVQMAVLASILG